tara:strand:+ start:455 stop:697 length:243 start_codon:yes stop_codon:yes gene_type:complete
MRTKIITLEIHDSITDFVTVYDPTGIKENNNLDFNIDIIGITESVNTESLLLMNNIKSFIKKSVIKELKQEILIHEFSRS